MHTTEIGNTVFNYNGGFDGDLRITDENGNVAEIPFDDVKSFVAMYVKHQKIAQLEESYTDQLLGLTG